MIIRRATLNDMNDIIDIYSSARRYMALTGNPNQWGDGYPSKEIIRAGIDNGQSFVFEEDGSIHAVFAFILGNDPTYDIIKDGEWLNDEPYGAIHRVASDGTFKGVFSACSEYCKGFTSNLKIDTYHENIIMQKQITSNGFVRCGIIHLENGSPRIAYQWTKGLKRNLEKSQLIERSIIKKYRKGIWNAFIGAVKEYKLISENDCIAVCISGGKDSMLLAKCMQQLSRHSEVPFKLRFIVMDPGYAPENRRLLEKNSHIMGIPIDIFENDIFDVVHDAGGSPCYLCARMRRGALYARARELGCNKIALGHHFDDVIETVLMSMLYSSEIKTMLPKLHSTNFEGMELIRPLYKVKERDIVAWANYNELKFLRCACKFTAESEHNEELSKRKEMKRLISQLRATNPEADENIFRSLHNVNMATIPGWRDCDKGQLHTFLENY